MGGILLTARNPIGKYAMVRYVSFWIVRFWSSETLLSTIPDTFENFKSRSCKQVDLTTVSP